MTYNDMDNHNTKISYENFTTAVPFRMPSTLSINSNNDPTSTPLGVIWIIIQMIFLTTLTFVMMCIIAYISRVKLVRDIYAIKV
uniref:Uncharacterized protein n=1 Tax=viral metagenome TaxID=1070528 RepID=A0A6C0KZP5_9ZZZZ